MWPMRPEMTRDECKKCLRCLELEAYGSMVSVLRAQGSFTSDKQRLLQELAKVLHISNERHRAEIRRAVNDEKLTTIAEQLNGPNTGTDWTMEGRRTIPLLPRLKARSACTILANSVSLATVVANKKKPDRSVISGQSGTAAETDSQPEVKIDEDLSIDTKLCNLENDLNKSETVQENSDLAEDANMDNKDVVDKIVDKPKVSKLPEKRKCPSPLPTAPPNKVLVLSKPLNHALWTIENKQASQVPEATTHHQNVALIPLTVGKMLDSKERITASEHSSERVAVPLNKHVVTTTISMCTSNTSNTKMAASTMQNKVSTKVVPAVSSSALCMPLNKMHSEDKDVQPQDNTNNTQESQRSENSSSNSTCKKRSMASIIHDAIVSSPSHRFAHAVTVYPGTTVSSGPGPPQSKQAPTTLVSKTLPSEQIATFNHQSTAKTGVTINSKKVVNMPHYSNAKLNTKTNVIVIQKGHAKGVTLSHAGKEVLGKVIMGGKNLCVTSQHNASSISVQPHHISLNNGDQTKTVLPIANSPQNTESVKTNIKSGNAAAMSLMTTRLRHDVSDKNKVISQFFDSIRALNSEPKTVIQSISARFPKGECNNDANTIDRESSLKTDPVIISTVEETQHRSVQNSSSDNVERRKDKDTSITCRTIDPFFTDFLLETKEILFRPKQISNVQDNAAGNIRVEKSEGNIDTCDVTLDSTNKNPQNFQCLLDNDENHEESTRSMVTINQMDEQGNS